MVEALTTRFRVRYLAREDNGEERQSFRDIDAANEQAAIAAFQKLSDGWGQPDTQVLQVDPVVEAPEPPRGPAGTAEDDPQLEAGGLPGIPGGMPTLPVRLDARQALSIDGALHRIADILEADEPERSPLFWPSMVVLAFIGGVFIGAVVIALGAR